MVEHKTKSHWVEEQKREMEKNRAVCGSLTTLPEDYPFSWVHDELRGTGNSASVNPEVQSRCLSFYL